MLVVTCSDELYHHGIKGQKWGVRRYQNPDGSLTKEGRARYGGRYDSEGRLTQKGYDNLEKLSGKYSKAYSNYSKLAYSHPNLNKKDTERGRKLSEKIQAAYNADPNKKPIKGSSNEAEGLSEMRELGNKYLSKEEAEEYSKILDKCTEKAKSHNMQVEKLKETRDKIGEKYNAATKEFIGQMVTHDSELRDVIERKKKQDEIEKKEWKRISDQGYLDKIGSDKSNPLSRHLHKQGDHYEFDGDGNEFWDMFADKQIQENTSNIERETNRALRKSVEKAYSNVMNEKLNELKDHWYNDFGDDPLTDLFGIGSEVVYGRNYGE